MMCLSLVFLSAPLFATLAEAQGGQVTVPNVLGQRLPNAQRALKRRGLRTRVTGQVTTRERRKSGTVARQNPGSGRRVRRGSTVTLTPFRFRR